MKFNRTAALLVGIASTLPIALFMAFFVLLEFRPASDRTGDTMEAILAALLGFWILALMVGYGVFLSYTDRVPPDKKNLWAALLFFGNVFTMPVFWYLYMWRRTGQRAEQPAHTDMSLRRRTRIGLIVLILLVLVHFSLFAWLQWKGHKRKERRQKAPEESRERMRVAEPSG